MIEIHKPFQVAARNVDAVKVARTAVSSGNKSDFLPNLMKEQQSISGSEDVMKNDTVKDSVMEGMAG